MTASRRGLLTALGAASVAVPVLAAPASPDAELIRLCDAYIATRDAFNAYDGPRSDDENPYEDALAEIERRLEGMEASTLAGIAAEARVALAVATQLDGSFCPTSAEDWLYQVVQDVLRLTGGAA